MPPDAEVRRNLFIIIRTNEEQKISIPPEIPPVKTITTQSWRSPNVGSIYRPDPDVPDMVIVGDGWFSSDGFSSDFLWGPSKWGTDYVMWVYDWEWQLDGVLQRFDPLNSLEGWDWAILNAGVTDNLFTPNFPGHRSVRVISRKYWNAPWLRYPHLL